MSSISSGSTHSMGGLAIERSRAFQLMADHLYKVAASKGWFNLDLDIANGVGIRVGRGEYVVSPKDDPRLDSFKASLYQLNQEVAITFSAPVVQAITDALMEDPASTLAITQEQNVQVVDSMFELGGARDAQGACFIRLEGKLVIWCSAVASIIQLAEHFDQQLIDYVWRCTSVDDAISQRTISSKASTSSTKSINTSRKSFSTRLRSFWSRDKIESTTTLDSLSEEIKSEKYYEEEIVAPRRPCHLKDLYTGLAVCLDLVICALSLKAYFRECLVDGDWSRLAIVLSLPFGFGVAFFFCENIISVIMQLVAPIGQMAGNTLYYSGQAPTRLTESFPHLTIMIPVYKESLKDVLAPTIESVQHAIRTYELQGGTANLLICEDGLQLVSEDEALQRVDYYERHSCAYVARHPENRAGRFKKSSNMNTALELSLRIEELLSQQRPIDVSYSQYDEDVLYNRVMVEALVELEGRVWAQGDIRIGDYILLLDSDTRIPADCFLDSLSEMEECPDVAILQHCSGTFLAGAGYFENFIAFFTKMVNYGISWVVSNGMSAPFMGHNAFLRWSALQEQAIKYGGPQKKIWSEAHVSEDFVMSLNLATAGYLIRWATYSKSQFLEGVSLSCDDELNRWQKYAFGCSEIMFNPIRDWSEKSPFASLFREFLWSPGSTLAYKFSSTSYVLSYWAIAAGVPTNIIGYWAVVIFRDDLDSAYTPPFELFVGIIVVFLFASSIGFATSRYRSRDCTFGAAVWQQLMALPFTVIFFAGISYHIFVALIAHLFSYNMTWSATVKDVTDTSFFEELPRVLKKYWHSYLVMIPTLTLVILFASTTFGVHWQQSSFGYILPLIWLCTAHILYPIVLNPTLMLFRF